MKIPVGAIDSKLERFAKEVGAIISKDSKSDWMPDEYGHRTLKWQENDFRFSIVVHPILRDEQLKKWSWCIVEKGDNTYSAHRSFIETKKLANIIVDIDRLLREAISYLRSLKFEGLNIQERPSF